jgi:hypothetical protein
MGHYYSEMYYDDRTPEQKKEDRKRDKKKAKLEKKICEIFECKPDEIKIIYEILKESIHL